MIVKKIIHLSQSIEGALRNWDDTDWNNCVLNDDGSKMNGAKAKSLFLKMKDDGKKVVPIGDCPNFSFYDGCQCMEIQTKSEVK